ncbi:MAG: STAS domain-containing protein [Chitinispirillaceae bacterium]|nr:STAS domain-containing protein [Chitinispirillaceae bacterium]
MNSENELRIEERPGYLWITLPDAITMYDNRAIEQKIGNRLRDRKDHVVLDFSHTRALYSSGLGLMIRIRRFVAERNGTVSLVNVSEPVYNMFTALNLDKVFHIYATDVEFEISQDDFMKKKETIGRLGFLFVAKLEEGVYRINISGEMTGEFDLSACREMRPADGVSLYLFDLSGLEAVDGAGAEALLEVTKNIAASKGCCRAYGAPGMILETLTLLGADKHVTFFSDEKSAYEGRSPLG